MTKTVQNGKLVDVPDATPEVVTEYKPRQRTNLRDLARQIHEETVSLRVGQSLQEAEEIAHAIKAEKSSITSNLTVTAALELGRRNRPGEGEGRRGSRG